MEWFVENHGVAVFANTSPPVLRILDLKVFLLDTDKIREGKKVFAYYDRTTDARRSVSALAKRETRLAAMALAQPGRPRSPAAPERKKCAAQRRRVTHQETSRTVGASDGTKTFWRPASVYAPPESKAGLQLKYNLDYIRPGRRALCVAARPAVKTEKEARAPQTDHIWSAAPHQRIAHAPPLRRAPPAATSDTGVRPCMQPPMGARTRARAGRWEDGLRPPRRDDARRFSPHAPPPHSPTK